MSRACARARVRMCVHAPAHVWRDPVARRPRGAAARSARCGRHTRCTRHARRTRRTRHAPRVGLVVVMRFLRCSLSLFPLQFTCSLFYWAAGFNATSAVHAPVRMTVDFRRARNRTLRWPQGDPQSHNLRSPSENAATHDLASVDNPPASSTETLLLGGVEHLWSSGYDVSLTR